jgi:hypothetical protein
VPSRGVDYNYARKQRFFSFYIQVRSCYVLFHCWSHVARVTVRVRKLQNVAGMNGEH